MQIDPIILSLFGAISVLFTGIIGVYNARYRSTVERCQNTESQLTDRCEKAEQEAKEYLAVIIMMRAEDGLEMDKAKETAANVLRGRRGYGS